MAEFLDSTYFQHFMLFTTAMAIISSRSISPEELLKARDNLSAFVEQSEELYFKV